MESTVLSPHKDVSSDEDEQKKNNTSVVQPELVAPAPATSSTTTPTPATTPASTPTSRSKRKTVTITEANDVKDEEKNKKKKNKKDSEVKDDAQVDAVVDCNYTWEDLNADEKEVLAANYVMNRIFKENNEPYKEAWLVLAEKIKAPFASDIFKKKEEEVKTKMEIEAKAKADIKQKQMGTTLFTIEEVSDNEDQSNKVKSFAHVRPYQSPDYQLSVCLNTLETILEAWKAGDIKCNATHCWDRCQFLLQALSAFANECTPPSAITRRTKTIISTTNPLRPIVKSQPARQGNSPVPLKTLVQVVQDEAKNKKLEMSSSMSETSCSSNTDKSRRQKPSNGLPKSNLAAPTSLISNTITRPLSDPTGEEQEENSTEEYTPDSNSDSNSDSDASISESSNSDQSDQSDQSESSAEEKTAEWLGSEDSEDEDSADDSGSDLIGFITDDSDVDEREKAAYRRKKKKRQAKQRSRRAAKRASKIHKKKNSNAHKKKSRAL